VAEESVGGQPRLVLLHESGQLCRQLICARGSQNAVLLERPPPICAEGFQGGTSLLASHLALWST
jgi:hypothetical protein